MNEQLELVAEAAWEREDQTIQAAFERFHRENPRVYELVCYFARELRDRGYEHGGVGFIWERMRWEIALDRDAYEAFKLNDHYRSRYSRLVMAQEPDLEGFFRTRELTAE